MASAKVVNMEGVEQRTIELNDAVFGAEANDAVVHNVVVALQNAKRQGTHKTKTRSEVSGGGAKPFRQKGTGRARQGSSREPHMRGGGVVFGPVPRSYKQKSPVRMRRQALRCALSDRVRSEDLAVLDGLKIESPKTKPFAQMVQKVAEDAKKVLLVLAENDSNVLLSARNLAHVSIRTAADLNVVDVLGAVRVVVQEEAVAKLEERLS